MRIIHPTTRSAARSEWGRRHNSLIVTAPFWVGAAAIVAVLWAFHALFGGDETATSSTAKAAKPTANQAAKQVANAGGEGIPILAIGVAGFVLLLLAIGVMTARQWRSDRTLERDVDLLEDGGARWTAEADDDEDEHGQQDTQPIGRHDDVA